LEFRFAARELLYTGLAWRGQDVEAGRRDNGELIAEPQVTVAHDGVAPKFQLFFGLNMQFPIGH
jgi:hypothetical protein